MSDLHQLSRRYNEETTRSAGDKNSSTDRTTWQSEFQGAEAPGWMASLSSGTTVNNYNYFFAADSSKDALASAPTDSTMPVD